MFNFVQIKGLLQRVLDRMHSGAMIPLKLTSDKLKRQASRRDNMKKYANYVVITDDKGKKRAFYNFHELIKYLDSFKMSFLPDNFTYTIHEE